MTDRSYIYENTEVVLTGRTAEKELATMRTMDYGGRVVPKIDVLHEVTPIDKEVGSWKKWVRMKDLYEIKQQ